MEIATLKWLAGKSSENEAQTEERKKESLRKLGRSKEGDGERSNTTGVKKRREVGSRGLWRLEMES